MNAGNELVFQLLLVGRRRQRQASHIAPIHRKLHVVGERQHADLFHAS